MSIAADGDVDVVNDFTAGTITSDAGVSGTTVTASTGFVLGDGDYIGVTGNEIITFNTAGTINISGASFDVDGAATATTYKADTSIEAPYFIANAAASAADAGAIRLANADNIAWEADEAGTDVVGISVDSSEVVQIAPSGSSGVTITPALTLSSTLTDGTATLNSGAWSGITTLAMGGAFSGATTIAQTHTAPTFTMNDSNNDADGTANILFQSAGAYDITGTIQTDIAGTPTTMITLDGVNSDLVLAPPDDIMLDPGGDVINFVSTTETMTLTNSGDVWTFDSAGDTFVFSDAVDVDGAFTAGSVASDAGVSGTTGSFTDAVTITNATPSLELADSTADDGTGNILFSTGTADKDIVATLQVDIANSAVTMLTLSGTDEEVLFGKKADIASLGIENCGTISDDAAITINSTGAGITLDADDTADQDIVFKVDDNSTDWAVTIDGSEQKVVIGSNGDMDHSIVFDADEADGTIQWHVDEQTMSFSGALSNTPQRITYDDDDDEDETVGTELTSSTIFVTGDNDEDSDSIDLQNGTVDGQQITFIAISLVDANDTFTVDVETDSTCTGCSESGSYALATVGDSVTLVWDATASAWYEIGYRIQ